MDYQQNSTTSKNRLSDRDMLLDLIITEKHISGLYDQGVLEAASSRIAEMFEQLQTGAHDNAREIFSAMQQRGWYNPEQPGRSGRVLNSRQKQTSPAFETTASSRYAVTSGSRRFGRNLSNGQRMGRSGAFNQRTEIESHDWQ